MDIADPGLLETVEIPVYMSPLLNPQFAAAEFDQARGMNTHRGRGDGSAAAEVEPERQRELQDVDGYALHEICENTGQRVPLGS